MGLLPVGTASCQVHTELERQLLFLAMRTVRHRSQAPSFWKGAEVEGFRVVVKPAKLKHLPTERRDVGNLIFPRWRQSQVAVLDPPYCLAAHEGEWEQGHWI